MLNRRHLLFVVAITVGIFAISLCFLVRSASEGPTWTNYTRIQDGMSFEEAGRILGKAETTSEGNGGDCIMIAVWIAKDNSTFLIAFMDDGKVIKQWVDSGQVTTFNKLFRCLHLE